jgi:hypothetical protein
LNEPSVQATAVDEITARTISSAAVKPKPRLITLQAAFPLLGIPLWAVATVLNWALPSDPWWALFGIAALLARRSSRTLVTALFISAVITWYGASGVVPYLGVSAIPDRSLALALNFFLFASLGAFLVGGSSPQAQRDRHLGRSWTLLAFAAIALLLTRFAVSGVPILLGDAGRLAGVANLSAVIGLASGALPIAVAFLPHVPSAASIWLKVVLAVLVFATASRLLLAAVLIGFLVRSPLLRRGSSAAQRYIFAAGIGLIVLLIIRVYALRTSDLTSGIFSGRTSTVGGFAGLVTEILGPSLYFASRNGLVVYELMRTGSFSPPGGFIIGGLANAVASGSDPERWLTQALGFDVVSVGAIATPIWSGATVDFGPAGAAVFAALLGAFLMTWARKAPFITVWIAFAVVLSSYGSYLVSAQFIASSALMMVMYARAGSRTAGA